jgi:hypothetical protein
MFLDPSHPLDMHEHLGDQPCLEKCKVTGRVNLASPVVTLEYEIVMDGDVPEMA